MADDLLIFLHLPKTAGTTFRDILTRQYPARALYGFEAGDEQHAAEIFAAMTPAKLARLRVISGHLPFGVHKLLPRKARYLTILRDPVERIVSQYFHVLRNHHHYCHEEVTRRNLSLGDFVTSGLTPETDNAQARMLAGVEQPAFGQCTEALLDQAQANLRKHFRLVGLTEHFEQTVLLARAMLGWSKPPYFSVRNVGWNKERHIPAEELEVVRAFNKLDLALYDSVRARLDAACAKFCPDWDKRLPAFRRRNFVYQKVQRTAKVVRGLLKL